MKLEKLDLTLLVPNSYNPNVMSDNKMEQLKKTLKTTGYWQFIIAREKEDGTYEIIDGEHRWRALQELPEFNQEPQYVVVVDSDDDVAKIQTINFNNLRGELDNIKVAGIINDLMATKSIEELNALLGYTPEEISNYLELLKFDFNQFDNLENNLDDDSLLTDGNEIKDKVFSIVLDKDDQALYLKAKNLLSENVDRGNDKLCFISILNNFIDNNSIPENSSEQISE
jgi:ParB/RepB/Spo0J family partition protein